MRRSLSSAPKIIFITSLPLEGLFKPIANCLKEKGYDAAEMDFSEVLKMSDEDISKSRLIFCIPHSNLRIDLETAPSLKTRNGSKTIPEEDLIILVVRSIKKWDIPRKEGLYIRSGYSAWSGRPVIPWEKDPLADPSEKYIDELLQKMKIHYKEPLNETSEQPIELTPFQAAITAIAKLRDELRDEMGRCGFIRFFTDFNNSKAAKYAALGQLFNGFNDKSITDIAGLADEAKKLINDPNVIYTSSVLTSRTATLLNNIIAAGDKTSTVKNTI